MSLGGSIFRIFFENDNDDNDDNDDDDDDDDDDDNDDDDDDDDNDDDDDDDRAAFTALCLWPGPQLLPIKPPP